MCSLYAKYVKILEICKHFSENLVNAVGNVPRRGVVPRFSDVEVVALSMTAEGIDSENLLFSRLKEFGGLMPNLISRRQFNDRRKASGGLCEEIRKRMVDSYDLSKASVHDIRYTGDIKQTHRNCCIIGDKGHISADIQLDLFETARIRLECPKRSNQKDWKPTFAPFAKARKRIETVFSQFDDQFMMKRNYAKKTRGLTGKVGAFTVLQYINSVNGRPVSRVKYALDS